MKKYKQPSAALTLGLFLSVAVSALSFISPLRAESNAYAESMAQEYQLKAAFLYNFAKFVEWPAQLDQEVGGYFVIGIYGGDPFGEDIDQLLMNKTVNEKKITVRRFRSVEDITPCHILFINSSEVRKLGDIMGQLSGKSVLTVSEASVFTANGGMINFIMEDNKVRFVINKQATDKVGLRISSQLLKLAKSVIS
jgi:hypothetical protein